MTWLAHLSSHTWIIQIIFSFWLHSVWQIRRSYFGYFLILFVFTIKNFSLFISVPHFCNLHWQKLLCGYGCYPIYKRLYSKLWETSIRLSGESIYQGPADRSDRPGHRIEPHFMVIKNLKCRIDQRLRYYYSNCSCWWSHFFKRWSRASSHLKMIPR